MRYRYSGAAHYTKLTISSCNNRFACTSRSDDVWRSHKRAGLVQAWHRVDAVASGTCALASFTAGLANRTYAKPVKQR